MRYHPTRLARRFRSAIAGRQDSERDTLALEMLSPLSDRFFPWTAMSMRPAAVLKIVNEIVIGDRQRVAECGSGISSIYIARALRSRRSGHLFTIEHDRRWSKMVASALDKEDLTEFATVVNAPLVGTSSVDVESWYDGQALAQVISQPVDLLVVDGPPAYMPGHSMARYPALPFFFQHLAADYAVVLDDVRRDGELQILNRWETEFALTFDRRYDDGVAIARNATSLAI